MSLDSSFRDRLEAKRHAKKRKITVGFTEWQYNTVHAFLEQMRTSGEVEKELGAPIKVSIDWSAQNEEKKPHVAFEGKNAHKIIALKDILEAASGN